MNTNRQIISASRRCDIPAFAADWFLQQLDQGFCDVANPFNPKQVSRVSLRPEDVAAFIFWSRNPAPFAAAIKLLAGLHLPFGFMITITGYGRELEPFCPSLPTATEGLQNLAAQIGPQRIIWRYDPIIISDRLDFAWHLQNFAKLARLIAPMVSGCIISLIDYYRKSERNLKNCGHQFMRMPEKDSEFSQFLAQLADIACRHGLRLSACCETDAAFAAAGIAATGCINSAWLEKITAQRFDLPRHKGQRPDCNCIFTRDIGSYDTCRHGCRYCYACR